MPRIDERSEDLLTDQAATYPATLPDRISEGWRSNGGNSWKFNIAFLNLIQCVSGWWLTYPSEKYESQLGWWFPIYGKIKNVPNHQPDFQSIDIASFGSEDGKPKSAACHLRWIQEPSIRTPRRGMSQNITAILIINCINQTLGMLELNNSWDIPIQVSKVSALFTMLKSELTNLHGSQLKLLMPGQTGQATPLEIGSNKLRSNGH